MLSRYIVVKPADHSLWEVQDDDGRVCYRTGSRIKAAGVAEFLQDFLSPNLEGVRAWIERGGNSGIA